MINPATQQVLARVPYATAQELEAAVAAARSAGIPIIMDTGSYKPWSESLLYGIDYLIAPSKFLLKQQPKARALDDAIDRAYAQFKPRLMAATEGDQGGRYRDESGLHRYAPWTVTTVDTCGAGDAFHGAFAWAIAAGGDPATAFQVAAWAAASKCATLGNAGLPTREALDQHLAG